MEFINSTLLFVNNSESTASISSGNITAVSSAAVIKYYAYGFILPAVCICGIVGNILNILTLRSPLLEAISYRYLRSLAFADLFCMAFVLIFVSKELKSGPITDFSFAWYSAHLELPLINLFITAGVLVVIGLTLDRYICIVFPMYFRSWNTDRHATMAISMAYLTSITLYVPMCWEKTVISTQGNSAFLIKPNLFITTSSWYVAYKWSRECAVKVLPVLLLAYFTVHMIVEFNRVRKRRSLILSSKKINANNELGLSSKGQRDERRLTVLLASIALMFFTCSTPAAVNLILINQSMNNYVPYQIFRAAANILEITNHSVNFYVFCFCSSDYRTEFLKTFPILRKLTNLGSTRVSSTLSKSSQQTRLTPTTNINGEKPPESHEIRSLLTSPMQHFPLRRSCDHLVYHHFITLSQSEDEEIVMLHNDTYEV